MTIYGATTCLALFCRWWHATSQLLLTAPLRILTNRNLDRFKKFATHITTSLKIASCPVSLFNCGVWELNHQFSGVISLVTPDKCDFNRERQPKSEMLLTSLMHARSYLYFGLFLTIRKKYTILKCKVKCFGN